MTENSNRVKRENDPITVGTEGVEANDETTTTEQPEDPVEGQAPGAGDRPYPRHPAGRRPLFRN